MNHGEKSAPSQLQHKQLTYRPKKEEEKAKENVSQKRREKYTEKNLLVIHRKR